MQRFLVGSRDTSHSQDYPSSGIYKQVCDLGDDIQRGNRGGDRASRGVFPPAAPVQSQSRAMRSRLDTPAVLFQLQSGASRNPHRSL